MALFISMVFSSCVGSAEGKSADPTKHRYASYEALAKLVSGEDPKPYKLIDVRTAQEFAEGRIPGASLLPYDQIGPGNPDLPKDSLVIVYCRSGRRSAIAAQALKQLGYTDIADFGGISSWKGMIER